MHSQLKPLLSLALSAMLALSGVNMALARGASEATGQMVICTGVGTVVVYVDDMGQPTSAPHICPDCMLAFAVPQERYVLAEPASFSRVKWHAAQFDRVRAMRRDGVSQPRAPPELSDHIQA